MRPSYLLASILLVAACGGAETSGSFGDDGGFGATPGGVKDMRYARELIAAGQVPPPEALLVEGMFAEHDLGLTGDPCAATLCLKAGAGVAPDRAGVPRGWLQVGLSSNINPDTWQPPPTTYIYTVDVSGSMGWEYAGGENPTPGALSHDLLHRLADELRPDDEVAIVTYGSDVATVLSVTGGENAAAVHAAIDDLSENGSTNMEAGLRRAYELGEQAIARGRSNVRVVLFTDVQPNVGLTAPSEFEEMVAAGADAGVEITVLALGLGIGPEVLEGIAHLRGANGFSLFDFTDSEQFIADEYPWFTTPIAYDLTVWVEPAEGLTIQDTYGFPGDFADDPRLDVSTVFLSKRKGGLLISLAGDSLDGLAADLELQFTTPAGSIRTTNLTVDRAGAPLDERGHWFAQPSVGKATALALLVSGMRTAAEQYETDHDAAEATMQIASDRFAADAAALADPALDAEVALASAMLQLIIDDAPQGSLYDEGF
jgi:Ca-activated chloride channel homolog